MQQQHALIGRSVGSYEIVRFIGKGGMSEVFEVRHSLMPKLRKAVKILFGHYTPSDSVYRKFQREAQILSGLNNPHVMRVSDTGFIDSRPYIIMDLYSYGNLNSSNTPLPVHTVVSYIRQIADGLAEAHAQGILHLDIKPENVLFADPGKKNVVICDFGIAKLQGATTTKSTFGTWEYMAPEVWRNKPSEKSDMYALAIMAYQLLCGTVPFPYSANPGDMLNKHFHVSPPSLHSHNVAVPKAVENVILKALSKKEDDRFNSVTDFADELESALSIAVNAPTFAANPVPLKQPQVQPAIPVRPAAKVGKPKGYNPGVVAVIVLLMFGVILGALSGLFVLIAATQIPVVAWSPDGNHFAEAITNAHIGDGMDEVVVYNRNFQREGTYEVGTPRVTSLVWSPDSKWIATGCDDGEIRVIYLPGNGWSNWFNAGSSAIRQIVWSPDSTHLATIDVDGTIKIWGSGGKPTGASWGGGGFTVIDWAWDSRWLTIGTEYGYVESWNIVTNQTVQNWHWSGKSITSLVHSHGPSEMAMGSTDGNIAVWNVQTNSIRTYTRFLTSIDAMSWSPDDSYIAAVGKPGRIARLYVSGGGFSSAFSITEMLSVSWEPVGSGNLFIVAGGDNGQLYYWQQA